MRIYTDCVILTQQQLASYSYRKHSSSMKQNSCILLFSLLVLHIITIFQHANGNETGDDSITPPVITVADPEILEQGKLSGVSHNT